MSPFWDYFLLSLAFGAAVSYLVRKVWARRLRSTEPLPAQDLIQLPKPKRVDHHV